MGRTLAVVLLLLVTSGMVACGGSSSGGSKNTPSSTDATFQSAKSDAAKTPVSDSVRAYAKQLCTPVKTFMSDAGNTLKEIEKQPTPKGTVSLEDALTQGFTLFGQLKDPIKNFQDALRKIDPPSDLKSYHSGLIAELGYALVAVDAVSKNGLAAAFALPTEEATPQAPSGLEAGLIQECGEDLQPFFDQFGGGFLGSSGPATATPPPPGKVGKAVQAGNFQLIVNSVSDPYTSTDESLQPAQGKRWVLLDVSLKNVSSKSQDYGSFDFKLSDTDNFQYDSTFVNQPNELNFASLLAGETIRGQLGYEVPKGAKLDRLIYTPGFSGEGRIDIKLR